MVVSASLSVRATERFLTRSLEGNKSRSTSGRNSLWVDLEARLQKRLGTMLANAQQFAARAPWAAVLPGLAIMTLALAFNVFGDSLRDALDPKANRR